eukprot:874647-Pelagomonas_calceolata.AAC.3
MLLPPPDTQVRVLARASGANLSVSVASLIWTAVAGAGASYRRQFVSLCCVGGHGSTRAGAAAAGWARGGSCRSCAHAGKKRKREEKKTSEAARTLPTTLKREDTHWLQELSACS